MLLFPNFQRSFQHFRWPHFFDGSAKVAALFIQAKFLFEFLQVFCFSKCSWLTFPRTNRLFFKAGRKYSEQIELYPNICA
jgi:hypothetical protein